MLYVGYLIILNGENIKHLCVLPFSRPRALSTIGDSDGVATQLAALL